METFNLRYFKAKSVIVLIIAITLSLYFVNKYISGNWGVSFSVISVVTGVFIIINNYLWKVKPFSLLYNAPDFSGRYEGTIKFEFRNEKCEIVSGTLEHIKIIHQNGSEIIVHSWTRKKDGSISSKSTSIEAHICKHKDGNFKLIYNYLNEGDIAQGFPPHYGTEVIELIKEATYKSLEGKYYTDRLPFQTRGYLSLNFVTKKLTHKI